MPELPEVQTVVTTLRPSLVGKWLGTVHLHRSDIVDPRDIDLPARLRGRFISDVQRRGKRIILTLDDGNRFYIHLGMTGRLTVNDAKEAVLPHTHFIVELRESSQNEDGPGRVGSSVKDAGIVKRASNAGRAGVPPTRSVLAQTADSARIVQLRFHDPRRFGGIWWLGSADGDQGIGPEPLTLRPEQLAQRLSRTARAIKNALLDQSVVAGLGNIYVDESLFTARIHPLAPADELSKDQIARLNRAIKATLRKAINNRGSTLRDYRDADGMPGDFQKLHRVYARAGKPCALCKTTIERIVLGGRSTCFCPKCQPGTLTRS